jgi:NADH-quinone oxidoreductase subunit E
MSDNSAKKIHSFVNASGMQSIDDWIKKYPAHEKQSAVMSALMIVQEQNGHLTPESMDAVADYLQMPAVSVYEVASFYSMYMLKPCGRHIISVCNSISCLLRDSASVIQHLEQQLDVKTGGTTDDGRFTLRTVECLGACVNAPMMQIDKDYHERLTPDIIDSVLEQYP